jgi:hypothetical protein
MVLVWYEGLNAWLRWLLEALFGTKTLGKSTMIPLKYENSVLRAGRWLSPILQENWQIRGRCQQQDVELDGRIEGMNLEKTKSVLFLRLSSPSITH